MNGTFQDWIPQFELLFHKIRLKNNRVNAEIFLGGNLYYSGFPTVVLVLLYASEGLFVSRMRDFKAYNLSFNINFYFLNFCEVSLLPCLKWVQSVRLSLHRYREWRFTTMVICLRYFCYFMKYVWKPIGPMKKKIWWKICIIVVLFSFTTLKYFSRCYTLSSIL